MIQSKLKIFKASSSLIPFAFPPPDLMNFYSLAALDYAGVASFFTIFFLHN